MNINAASHKLISDQLPGMGMLDSMVPLRPGYTAMASAYMLPWLFRGENMFTLGLESHIQVTFTLKLSCNITCLE